MYSCPCVSRYSKINSIHNVIYFRIALKTTVQRHISVCVFIFLFLCWVWARHASSYPAIKIGKNEKRLCESFKWERICVCAIANANVLNSLAYVPYSIWWKEKYGDHDKAMQKKSKLCKVFWLFWHILLFHTIPDSFVRFIIVYRLVL